MASYDRDTAKSVICKHYHDEGAEYCAERIPGMSKKQVQSFAHKIGVGLSKEAASRARRAGRGDHSVYDWDVIDAVIRREYPGHGTRYCVGQLTKIGIKMSNTTLKSRVCKIGVKIDKKKYNKYRAQINWENAQLRRSQTEKPSVWRMLDAMSDIDRFAMYMPWNIRRVRDVYEPLESC